MTISQSDRALHSIAEGIAQLTNEELPSAVAILGANLARIAEALTEINGNIHRIAIQIDTTNDRLRYIEDAINHVEVGADVNR